MVSQQVAVCDVQFNELPVCGSCVLQYHKAFWGLWSIVEKKIVILRTLLPDSYTFIKKTCLFCHCLKETVSFVTMKNALWNLVPNVCPFMEQCVNGEYLFWPLIPASDPYFPFRAFLSIHCHLQEMVFLICYHEIHLYFNIL